MPLQKDSITINFAKGIDTKSDAKQIPLGNFLELQNAIFEKGGLLQKRNGFSQLTTLSDSTLTTLSTFNGNLTAIGSSLYSYNQEAMTWINKGTIIPCSLNTLPVVRSSTGQTSSDVAIKDELACIAWTDTDTFCKYRVVNKTTGEIIVQNTNLPTGAATPRVFTVSNKFVITFLISITGTIHLQYIAVPTNDLTNPTVATDLSTQVKLITSAYDGQVIANQLYLAWDGSDGGGAVRATYLLPTLAQGTTIAIATNNCARVSVCGDTSQPSPIVWISWVDSSNNIYTKNYTSQLAALLARQTVETGVTVYNLTSTATGNVNTVFYEVQNNYSYAAVRSDYIRKNTVTGAGVVGTASNVIRGLGLASKAFIVNFVTYMLCAYNGSYQPTYFLIDSSGILVAKLAYQNGGGYPTTQVLSNALVDGSSVTISYLYKSILIPVNKDQGVTTVGGLYTLTGINLATFDLTNKEMDSAEIAGVRHFGGGYLWMYDGVKPVEHGFHLYPEDLKNTTSTTGGSLTAQIYNYVATYEWTDAQGNIHRSAPSIPLVVDISGSGTSTNKNTLDIPTLRETLKDTANNVRIVIYRWSTAQQTFYQITSISSPLNNNTSVDSVQYVDTAADSSIIGNPILYTTGGVVENIGAPACFGLALFKNRLWFINSEDKNQLWYSKVVLESTPVETSDLFTIYIAPTTGSQGSTGPLTALSAMDDKLIPFKTNALYYIAGNGPDATGANNDFSEPVFITSTVGCNNQQSIVFMPTGLMFQSDKGIWQLARDLSSQYVGAQVEAFNDDIVKSALNIPGTNQVRFTLETGITLMYDYYFQQWGTFTGIPAISSTLYQDTHTFLNKYLQVLQESPGLYLDGSNPVLLGFKTGWINLMGVQGFQRAYECYMIGQYYSPHLVNVKVAFDYSPSFSQSSTFYPINYTPTYGGDALYGTVSPYGGSNGVEWFRTFFEKQRCSAIQIGFQEIYDGTYGVAAGQGLSLSGINLVYGGKSKYPRIAPSLSIG